MNLSTFMDLLDIEYEEQNIKMGKLFLHTSRDVMSKSLVVVVRVVNRVIDVYG